MTPTLCACGCGRTFIPPTSAPHKRFFSATCRNKFWLARRLEALKLLDSLNSQEPPT